MRRLIPILALAFVGCQSLEITNPNLPDRSRATQQPTAAESFVSTAFRTWWPVGGHDDYPFIVVDYPHIPTAVWSPEEIVEIAKEVAPQVRELLTRQLPKT